MKYIVGFSGGIDSSFVAYLLKKQGHEVLLVHLKITKEKNKCCQLPENLIKIANKLDLPLKIVDATNEFKKLVIDYFAKSYIKWITPNPCIRCNQLVRFPLLNKIREELNFDKIATGHYAKIIDYKDLSEDLFRRLLDDIYKDGRRWIRWLSDDSYNNYRWLVRWWSENKSSSENLLKQSSDESLYKLSDSSLFLVRPKDLKKDQTYMLYPIMSLKTFSWESLLNYLEFPLWNYFKEEVKKIFSTEMPQLFEEIYSLQNYKESQNICFIPDDDYPRFLKQNYKIKSIPWPIYDKYWNYLGEHKWLIYYTIWQRRGIFLNQQKNAMNKKWYVIKIDYENNSLILGQEEDLYQKEIVIKDVFNCINYSLVNKLLSSKLLYGKIRYHHIWEYIQNIYPIEKNIYKITFTSPVRAPTPGQHCVIYYWKKTTNDLVLGWWIILS